jgi:hypothetical protein
MDFPVVTPLMLIFERVRWCEAKACCRWMLHRAVHLRSTSLASAPQSFGTPPCSANDHRMGTEGVGQLLVYWVRQCMRLMAKTRASVHAPQGNKDRCFPEADDVAYCLHTGLTVWARPPSPRLFFFLPLRRSRRTWLQPRAHNF